MERADANESILLDPVSAPVFFVSSENDRIINAPGKNKDKERKQNSRFYTNKGFEHDHDEKSSANHRVQVIAIITFYSTSCLGQLGDSDVTFR